MLKATASYPLFLLFLALPTQRAALDQYYKQINCLIATVHGVVGLSADVMRLQVWRWLWAGLQQLHWHPAAVPQVLGEAGRRRQQ
jgi:hypothetical protein